MQALAVWLEPRGRARAARLVGAPMMALLLAGCDTLNGPYFAWSCEIEERELASAYAAIRELMRTGELGERRGRARLDALERQARGYRAGELTCQKFQTILDGYIQAAPAAQGVRRAPDGARARDQRHTVNG